MVKYLIKKGLIPMKKEWAQDSVKAQVDGVSIHFSMFSGNQMDTK